MALGSNTGMGFLRTKWFIVIQNGEFQFGFLVLIKTIVYGGLQAENKMKKNKKKNSLKHRATGVEVLGQMRGSRVLFLALERMTDRPKMRCVKCVPKCASVRVAPSNIMYYCKDIDPQGKVN